MAIFRGSYKFLYGLESYPRPIISRHNGVTSILGLSAPCVSELLKSFRGVPVTVITAPTMVRRS